MSDDFENINSRIPDLATALAQRIAARNGTPSSTTTPAPGTVDPYQLMLNKKSGIETPIASPDPNTVIRWPEEDIKKLEDYCIKMGVHGFNCGRMSPIAALAMLKSQLGDYAGVPLENRIPDGYEKRGTHSGYSANYPYTEAMRKKQILHG